MQKRVTKSLPKLYPLPGEKSTERAKKWDGKKYAKKLELQFERMSNKEYQDWLTK